MRAAGKLNSSEDLTTIITYVYDVIDSPAMAAAMRRRGAGASSSSPVTETEAADEPSAGASPAL